MVPFLNQDFTVYLKVDELTFCRACERIFCIVFHTRTTGERYDVSDFLFYSEAIWKFSMSSIDLILIKLPFQFVLILD